MNRKTRFLVRVSGKEHQLFSCEERDNDDSVLIGFKGGSIVTDKTSARSWHSIHISLHPSARGGTGRTVTQVYKLPSNREGLRRSAFIQKIDGQKFLWPVYTEVAPRVKYSSFKSKAGDDICKVAAYDGTKYTLCTALFAAEPDVELPAVQGFSKVERVFRAFKIVLYYAFMGGRPNMPLMGVFYQMASRLVDERKIDLANFACASPFPLSRIELHLQQSILIIVGWNEGRRKGGLILPPQAPPTFSRWPREMSFSDAGYGENAPRSTKRNLSPITRYGILKTPEMMAFERLSPLSYIADQTSIRDL